MRGEGPRFRRAGCGQVSVSDVYIIIFFKVYKSKLLNFRPTKVSIVWRLSVP